LSEGRGDSGELVIKAAALLLAQSGWRVGLGLRSV
jgi:hypothetical protein